MKKNIINEIQDMKYLFNYERGRILSEQNVEQTDKIDLDEFELENDVDMMAVDEEENSNYDLYEDVFENIDFEVPTMMPGTKEIVKPGTKEKEKTKSPSTPYKPKPGPKPDPKARSRKGEMPDWLTFDELGIDFE